MTNKDIFLSHAWGTDHENRNNHHRVKLLSKQLISKGYSVWFDENDIIGNIDNSIIKGITNSQVVIVCLTEKYCNKINNSVYHNSPNDNCYKEWNYTLFCKKKILATIMEVSMHDIYTKNKGVVQMYLNNSLYVDFSENLEDNFSKLLKTLQYYQIFPYINTKLFVKNDYYKKLIKSKSLPNFNKFILSSPKSPKSPTLRRRAFIKL